LAALQSGTVKIRAIRILLNDTENANSVSDIVLEYKTDRESNYLFTSAVGESTTFSSNIGWQPYPKTNHWATKSVTESKVYKYIVYDSAESTAESGSVPSYNEVTADPHNASNTVQINDKPSVGWTIAGNVQNTYASDGDVTYTFTLPEGVTLAADQTKFYKKVGGNLTEITDGSISLSGNTVTVSPEARLDANGTSPAEFRIMLKASVNDLGDSSSVWTDGVAYRLSVTDSLGAEMPQEQKIKLSLISKSGKQQESWKSETYDDGYGNQKTGTYNEKSHYIDFTLDVNPKAMTINGGEKITVYDFMKNHKYTGVRLILVGLKVYQYTNGSSEPQLLDNSQYTYTASNASIEEDLSGTLRALDTNADPNGSWFYLKLNDATHYKVEYTYHYLNNNSTVDKYTAYDFNGYNVNTAKILGSSNNVIGVSESITLTKLGRLYNTDTDDDDYAVIEAVSEDNYNVKIPNCYFAMLRYAGNNSWEVMTSSHEENGKIIPDTWKPYTEIERGDTPETVRSKNHNCVLLGPTDSQGRTRLPELQTEGKFYRIVEVQPAAGYAVNPDKLYMTYLNTRPTAENQPNVLFYDQMTAVYSSNDSSYNGNMVGTVIIENTGRGSRDVTLNKEWIDSVDVHQDVTFDSFRSYETKSRSNVQQITFKMTDQNGTVGDVKTFYVSYGSSFIISIQNTGLATYADKVVFDVNGKSITPAHSNNPWYQEQDGIYSATIRNRVGDDESIVYYSYPASRNGVYPPGITCDGDASVWCKNVTRDYIIYLRADDYSVNSGTVIDYTPKFTKGDYDTFDNLPDQDDRLKNGNKYAMTRLVKKSDGTYEEADLPDNSITVTIGETDSWTYKWYDLPEMDCYGFKYYYYVEELPESPDTKAEDTLNRKYNSANGYEIRYFNNGAINSDTITVRNHEKSFIKSLPATGGEGRDLIIGMGLSLISCAGILLFLRKRSQGAKRRP
jgi:LPXTG-motif cell wall-anchored protein